MGVIKDAADGIGKSIQALIELWDRFQQWRRDRRDKAVLLQELNDPRFPQRQRSFAHLSKRIGGQDDEERVKRLLRELDAVGVTLNDGTPGWTLKRPGP